MTELLDVVYERTNESDSALVVKVADIEKLDDPKIQAMVEKSGLTLELLKKLLTLDPSIMVEGPSLESPIFNSRGDKIEDAVTWLANTPIGKVEVADCKLYKAVVTGRDDQSLHLKVAKMGGFEVIYALEGEATLDFPESVEPVSGSYIASKEKIQVKMEPGTMAIIPAPTANAWSMVGEGFKFRYICQPAWSSSFVKPVLDQ